MRGVGWLMVLCSVAAVAACFPDDPREREEARGLAGGSSGSSGSGGEAGGAGRGGGGAGHGGSGGSAGASGSAGLGGTGGSGGEALCPAATASFENAACNRCMNAECCEEMVDCNVGTACFALIDCSQRCYADPDPQACYDVQCAEERTSAALGARNGLLSGCLPTHCPAPCGVTQPACAAKTKRTKPTCDSCLRGTCCAELTACDPEQPCGQLRACLEQSGCPNIGRYDVFDTCIGLKCNQFFMTPAENAYNAVYPSPPDGCGATYCAAQCGP